MKTAAARPAGQALPGLAKELAALGADALLILARSARDPDLAPFVGPVHLHDSFLIAVGEGAGWLGYLSPMERAEAEASGWELLTPETLDVARWVREGAREEELMGPVVEQALLRTGLGGGRLALAGHPAAGTVEAVCASLRANGWSFVSGRAVARRLRRLKSGEAAREARRVAGAATEAIRRVATLLTAARPRAEELWLEGERLRAGRLRREIALALAEHGLQQPEGNIVAAGRDAAVPHTAGCDKRVLRLGESVVVDLYPKGWLFADCTRTFCVGEAPSALKAGHASVLRALQQARAQARPGRGGWELQEAVCGWLEEDGYPTPLSHPGTTRGYVHGLGHGVGWELHELPSFRPRAGEDGELAAGDLFTLEPGLYDEEAGLAVRLEDLFLLAPEGPEQLTLLPHDLDPQAHVEDP